MTQKDESPNASEGPYWSEELLAVLVVGLGDETADVSSAMGFTRRLAAEVVLAGLVYWRHERGERRQSP